jgi:hypothetical protein
MTHWRVLFHNLPGAGKASAQGIYLALIVLILRLYPRPSPTIQPSPALEIACYPPNGRLLGPLDTCRRASGH